MNSYKYKPSTVLFDERVKLALTKIQNDFNNGKIKTKSQYAYEIKQAVFNFYNSMGKPTYKYIEASDVPSFVHYKDMVQKAVSDMSCVIQGCEHINSILEEMNTSMIEETEGVNKNIYLIEGKIQEIENKIKTISDASSMVFTDSFEKNELNSYGEDNNENNLGHADIDDGICGLASDKWLTETGVNVSILDTSNGFPGSTHEVFETMSGTKFIGESDPRLNIHSVLTNDSKDWFEFEMFNLDDDVVLKTSSVGFKYKEGISWVSNDDELTLDLKITLNNPRVLNVLKINGIPKVNHYTDHPVIKEIIIKDDYAGVQVINYGDYLLEKTKINFKPQVVKEIIIKISQRDSVSTKVSRSYSLSIDPTKIPYFVNDDFKEFTQIDKPTISIESLGLSYNAATKGIVYPSTQSNNSFLNKEYVKANLFYSTINASDNTKLFTEIVDAYKYRIGISYIGLEYKEYVEDGIYISSEFEVDKPIRRVTLNAIDKIPKSFINPDIEGEKRIPFISYYISFNNEEEWIQVYPRTNHESGPCTVVVNSFLNIESRNKNITYIDRLIEPTSVRLKIELRRPVDVIDETPIVYEYNLDIDGEE